MLSFESIQFAPSSRRYFAQGSRLMQKARAQSMTFAASAVALRPKWLFNTVQEFQVAIGLLDNLDALRDRLDRVRRPHTPAEELILRGLKAQLELHRLAGAATHLKCHVPVEVEVDLAVRAKQLIDLKYDEVTTVEQIAGTIGCHPVHLERLFRRRYGTTVHRYLRAVRVDASLSLLSKSMVKIEAIPHLVGFKGKSTFYRAIQETTGHTPGYLRQHPSSPIELV